MHGLQNCFVDNNNVNNSKRENAPRGMDGNLQAVVKLFRCRAASKRRGRRADKVPPPQPKKPLSLFAFFVRDITHSDYKQTESKHTLANNYYVRHTGEPRVEDADRSIRRNHHGDAAATEQQVVPWWYGARSKIVTKRPGTVRGKTSNAAAAEHWHTFPIKCCVLSVVASILWGRSESLNVNCEFSAGLFARPRCRSRLIRNRRNRHGFHCNKRISKAV